MTLYTLVEHFKSIASAQPNVRSSWEGNVYTLMNGNSSIEYKAFILTQQNHRETEYSDIYSLTLYLIDRLVDDRETNRLRAQSLCKEQLSNIIKVFVDMADIDYPDNITFFTFTQRFKDECAGCYAQLEVELPKSPCYDGEYPAWREEKIKLQAKTIEINENTDELVIRPDNGYSGLSKVTIKVDVPQGDCRLQEKDFIINSNGTTQLVADAGFDGIAGGRIIVNVPIPEPEPCPPCPDCPPTDYEPETLTVNITADKHIEDLIGKQLVNVIYDGEDHKYVYRGEAIAIPVPPGKIYTVEYLDVEDFDTPESTGEQYVSMWGGQNELSASYTFNGQEPIPPAPSNYCLTFHADGDQVLKITTHDFAHIEYSFDKTNWVMAADNIEIPYGGNTEVYVRGINNTLIQKDGKIEHHVALINTNDVATSVYGDFMSLIDYEHTLTQLPEGFAADGLFIHSYLTDASGLILPDSTRQNCYWDMFNLCINLEKAPVLRAQHAAKGCYQTMFMGCPKLTEITMLCKTWDDANFYVAILGETHYQGETIKGSPVGVLTVHEGIGATIQRGDNFIPNGWTITELED